MNDDDLKQALETLIGSRLALAEEERIERRRYALLQAAIAILPTIASRDQFDGIQIKVAVDVAEMLLTEIEKRENAEAQP